MVFVYKIKVSPYEDNFILSAISMLLLLVVLCEAGNFSIIFSINFNISCLKKRTTLFSNAVVVVVVVEAGA